ncbi:MULTISPECIES: dihydrolipoamide acetyltransferase family protein [Empedobacter]|uniref:Dihydrolipoamide acetyltransferase component of pyruvate dehydrogenase complex n=1 Tax=Empedobacter falsenii TaxID=343874 RepID=A0A376G8N1_9FLAO|nr:MULTISPECIES: dihydrolipoamide acetyltransferase family protein [Empedobacter]MDH0674214.1 2-oxo acid dehydrogenase subunit E2 [Empedobacter sp. GD03861]MDH1881468.1 2-oxo acid dehydrogenase subunit E2 [Empedobacter sp. GD03797]MDM1040386.1 2-oxo acid dehydrogenase subunit E2 [Empedobacter brevis]MDM1134318.1 2-oxo acid dehydrogenase subunit E2 [Empedobacter sp. R750]STD56048.1 Dihydrolipoyllysine-residue acetyltransferase component of pyruvate dehydrogenase complex [Empedobacter falsenii]
MKNIELTIPKLGESVESVQLVRFTKNVGDFIQEDEVIAEVSTDKVDSDVPSTTAGKIIEFRFNEGDEIKIGEVFALIEPSENQQQLAQKTENVEEKKIETATTSQTINSIDTNQFLSPLVKSIIQKENLQSTDISQIKGSGRDGRISKNDVLNYIKNKSFTTNNSSNALSENNVVSSSSFGAKDEIIEMDKMRQLISKHMKKSKQTSPHVTAYVEPDVTNFVKWREENKAAFEAKYKQKLTFTPLIVDCVVRAIKDFPMVNVSVDETETKIIKHNEINIGIATALPNNNLIVPVIHQANELNLEGLAKGVNSIVDKARNNKLSPDDVRGGTFTISNVGTFGNLMGTPIINQPEVAILATGVIKKKPAVLETEFGDIIVARQFMYLSLSFDHRVIDGSLGGVFLKRISDYMENWDVNTQI